MLRSLSYRFLFLFCRRLRPLCFRVRLAARPDMGFVAEAANAADRRMHWAKLVKPQLVPPVRYSAHHCADCADDGAICQQDRNDYSIGTSKRSHRTLHRPTNLLAASTLHSRVGANISDIPAWQETGSRCAAAPVSFRRDRGRRPRLNIANPQRMVCGRAARTSATSLGTIFQASGVVRFQRNRGSHSSRSTCLLLAQSGHSLVALHMSAFRGKADMAFCSANVCFLTQSGHFNRALSCCYVRALALRPILPQRAIFYDAEPVHKFAGEREGGNPKRHEG